MTVTAICSLDEVLSYLGADSSAVTDADRIALVKRLSEQAVRRYVGCSITHATHTHILPHTAHCWNHTNLGEVLRLPEWPVREIVNLWEDPSAYGGSASGSFLTADLLTQGSDYYLAVDRRASASTSLSFFGHVIRLKSTWPAVPGSIKIEYNAGWTADELDGDVDDPGLDASDIKLAVLKAVSEIYGRAKYQTDPDERVLSERLDDYAATYADVGLRMGDAQLPMDAKLLLAPFRRRKV